MRSVLAANRPSFTNLWPYYIAMDEEIVAPKKKKEKEETLTPKDAAEKTAKPKEKKAPKKAKEKEGDVSLILI